MTTPLAIWGASGHALVATDIVRLRGEHEVVGYLDDRPAAERPAEVRGVPVLGGEDQLGRLWDRGVRHLLVAFGSNRARLAKAVRAELYGFRLITAVHPSAVVAGDASIGPGTLVAAQAVVAPGCRIGTAAIINTAASVDHECAIADGAAVAPGARLAGRVSVGRLAWIGIGATLIDRVVVGDNSLVGAGAVVTRDLPSNCVAYGVPARVIRTRRPDE